MNLARILLISAMALAGCNANPTKKFSVTVTDADLTACDAYAITPSFSGTNLTQLAHAVELDYQTRHHISPSVPQGRILNELESDRGMEAWFDSFEGIDQFGNLSPVGPNEVFKGDLQDNYIDGTFLAITNLNNTMSGPQGGGDKMTKPDAQCVELVTVNEQILATLYGGGIDGRIRRTDIGYQNFGISPCDVAIRCTRYQALSGNQQ